MINEIVKILNYKYDNKITARLRNGDYDLYYENKLTPVSFSNGKLGDAENVVILVENELNYFLEHNKVKIITEDNNGIKEVSHGSKNRKRRRYRKRV